jgi:uncharacterized membrane protein
MPEILFIHIVSASFALLGGYAALFARKGGVLHRRAGALFVWAMIVMGFSASMLARAEGDGWLSGRGLSGLMLTYLVISAVATVRDPDTVPRWLHPALMVVGLGLGALVTTAAILQVSGMIPRHGVPVVTLIYGVILLLAGLGDVRLQLRGPLAGRARVKRHMWRMCFAMFNATGSFFLGQADEIPEPLRIWPILILLAVLPLLAMLYYFVREGLRQRRLLGIRETSWAGQRAGVPSALRRMLPGRDAA